MATHHWIIICGIKHHVQVGITAGCGRVDRWIYNGEGDGYVGEDDGGVGEDHGDDDGPRQRSGATGSKGGEAPFFFFFLALQKNTLL